MEKTSDLNVKEISLLPSPHELKQKLPITEKISETVFESREQIKRILDKKDKRMLLIIGPCSIHDPKAALEYATKLADLREKYKDRLFIVMRVYFEKPRTTIGWKGLITDPQIDGLDDVSTGLHTARELLIKIAEIGLPTATEFLDPIVPQYISGIVSWAAIGARTTESQTHRQMASGLSMPVGFKNNTEGNKKIAVEAMMSARSPHSFLGIDENGRTSVVKTHGNNYGHIILRGGTQKTNFDPESIKEAEELLGTAGMSAGIMVDCSHANSGKKHEKQEVAWRSILDQRVDGNDSLIGMMLESNLFEGNQKLPKPLHSNVINELEYGVSITDACVSWESTEELVALAYEKMGRVLESGVSVG